MRRNKPPLCGTTKNAAIDRNGIKLEVSSIAAAPASIDVCVKTMGTSQTYYPNLVPLSAIRRYARAIAKRFKPQQVILFGSYADGDPTPDSDVDLLVVMPTRNELEQAVRIDEALDRGFALDLIVRTPRNLQQRLQWGDLFLQEIVQRGKVLYEQADRGVGQEGRRRSRRGSKTGRGARKVP
jgi:predicted nucleotidyltransferase